MTVKRLTESLKYFNDSQEIVLYSENGPLAISEIVFKTQSLEKETFVQMRIWVKVEAFPS